MHTVDLLEEALTVARRLGYGVRHEWLDGAGGTCEFGGRRWLFVDLALNVGEQFGQVADTLRSDPGLQKVKLSTPLKRALKSA